MRQVIGDKLRQATAELASDLAALPAYEGWERQDIMMVADLFVGHIVQLATPCSTCPRTSRLRKRGSSPSRGGSCT